MPRDTQVVRSAPNAAPKDYTVDKNVELILRGVTAQFDGSGAAGDFLPCVDLISDSGHLIARCCDPNVKVTAGDSQTASWFPDVKPSAAVAASSGQATMVALTTFGSEQSIPAGTTTALNWDSFADDGSGTFTVPAGTGGSWSINVDGTYLVVMALIPDPSWPTEASGPVRFAVEAPADTLVYGGWNSYVPGSANPGFFGGIVATFGVLPASFSARLQNQSSTTFSVVHEPVGANGTALSMLRLGPEVPVP